MGDKKRPEHNINLSLQNMCPDTWSSIFLTDFQMVFFQINSYAQYEANQFPYLFNSVFKGLSGEKGRKGSAGERGEKVKLNHPVNFAVC